jgi:hypothetical protein
MLLSNQQDAVLRSNAGVPGSFTEDFRCEKDALMALQLMTEHLLVMFFEMTQFFCFAKLINSQRLAMYAKRVIIKESDTE